MVLHIYCYVKSHFFTVLFIDDRLPIHQSFSSTSHFITYVSRRSDPLTEIFSLAVPSPIFISTIFAMRSSTLLALIAAFGPAAVLSSPRPPPRWEVEVITVSFNTARFAHHPPHVPGATATTADTALGAGEPTGTLTGLSPTITSEPDDECENEGSSTLGLSGLATYPTAGGSLSVYGGASDLSSSSSLTSSLTTLSTIPVAAKNRRQVDSPLTTTTTSATSGPIPAGVTAPDGYAGTAVYPASIASDTAGLPTITPGGVKKVKGGGCAKGPGKSVSKGAGLMTTGSLSALGDVYGGATSSATVVGM